MPGWNSSSRNSFADDQPIRYESIIQDPGSQNSNLKINLSFGKEKPSKWWKVVEKMTGRRKSTTEVTVSKKEVRDHAQRRASVIVVMN